METKPFPHLILPFPGCVLMLPSISHTEKMGFQICHSQPLRRPVILPRYSGMLLPKPISSHWNPAHHWRTCFNSTFFKKFSLILLCFEARVMFSSFGTLYLFYDTWILLWWVGAYEGSVFPARLQAPRHWGLGDLSLPPWFALHYVHNMWSGIT